MKRRATDPNPFVAARAEYLARIHRVMDHIERYLDERLTLEDLARVACFSPFHFHRVFTACAGESLYRFILRLRLEKAASQLLQNPRKSITAIALDCGFGSSAAFARAFRSGFGTSASEWRAAGSKNREAIGKVGEELEALSGYAASSAAAQPAGGDTNRRMPMPPTPSPMPVKPADSVRIENAQPFTVAYVRNVGPYAGDSALFGRLFGQLCQWAGPRGLLGPGVRMLTLYHDNPEITAEEKLRISVCATVPPGTKPEGEIGVMQVDGGRYAVATFTLDPSEYGAAWNWLMGTWFPSSGYQPDDRLCFETYLNEPEKHPQKKHHVEIWEPVRPL
jgi:AraC family transcriptional regulator